MLGMLAEWLVWEWGGAFSTVGGPDQAVCLRMKVTTKFGCVAKFAVFAVGAAGTDIGVELLNQQNAISHMT